MKRLTIAAIALAILVQLASGQNSKVTRGVLDYQSGSLEEAIAKLEEALSRPDLLSPKNLAKAHYFAFLSYLENGRKVESGTDSSGREHSTMRNPAQLLKSAQYLAKFLEDPQGLKYAELPAKKYLLWGALFNFGVTQFNEKQYGMALTYFQNADRLNPDHFLTKRMIGSVYVIQGESISREPGCTQEDERGTSVCADAKRLFRSAIEQLEKAIAIFERDYDKDTEDGRERRQTPAFETDLAQAAFVFQQTAVLYSGWLNDHRKALEIIRRGLVQLPGNEGLLRQELSVFQNAPELLEEGKVAFERAIAAHPSDVNLKLAYAGLLQKVGEDEKAKSLYERAYRQDPQNLGANSGLATYFINRAVDLRSRVDSIKEEAALEKAFRDIEALLRKAYPHLKFLHEAQPEEREWLRQLMSVTANLGMDAELREYAHKLDELNRQ